jgi:uncharacterized membrane protein YqiK
MGEADQTGLNLSKMSIETIVIIVVLIVLFGGGGGYWYSRRRQTKKPPDTVLIVKQWETACAEDFASRL